ncbi:MAG: hypothetical protein M1830_002145 [Pleopsidium flavum]|nr:MAG: hypothetical protein M1830_002145 [Pleopsidium flavum]
MADEAQAPTLSTPPSHYLSGWRLGMVIVSLYLGTFVMALDTNIIGVAVPKISSEFQALEDVAWYGSAYLLAITAFQPAFGNVYKFFSVQGTYRTCIVVFEVARAVAGLGAAGLLQGSLSIIGYAVELEKRPLYMGIVISVFAISVCVGPVIGGALTTNSTWRWCFWINVPIGAVVLVLLFLFLKIKGTDNENRMLPIKAKLNHMDPLGCLVFIAAVCCILLALQWGGQSKPWNSSTVIGLFVGFGLLSCVFGYIQWKLGERATIPLRILRQRSILTGAGVLFFLGASTYVDSFYIPFWFQAVQGVEPITSGIRFIPLFLAQMVALIITGAVVTQWGYYVPYMVLGEAICIVGTALLTRLEPTTSTVAWAAFLVVTGIGMGIAMQLPYTAIQVVLHEDDVPTGNAIAVFAWQLGGAVSIAVGQTITISTILDSLPSLVPGLSPAAVIAAGAINLPGIAPSPAALDSLRSIWNTAISRAMIFSLAMLCAAVPFTLGMEWLNAKNIASGRKASAEKPDSKDTEEGLETNQPKASAGSVTEMRDVEKGTEINHVKASGGTTTDL